MAGMRPLGSTDPGAGGEVAAVSAPPATPAHLSPVWKCPRTAFRKWW